MGAPRGLRSRGRIQSPPGEGLAAPRDLLAAGLDLIECGEKKTPGKNRGKSPSGIRGRLLAARSAHTSLLITGKKQQSLGEVARERLQTLSESGKRSLVSGLFFF